MKKTLASMAILAGGLAVAANAGMLNAGNTTVAEEYIAAGNTTTIGLANAFQPGVPVAATSQLKLTLSAGKFTVGSGNGIILCDANNNAVAGGTVDAGAQTATLTVSTALAGGNVYTIVSGTDSTACPAKYIQYDLTGLTAGTVVTLDIQSPQAPGANASAPVATIKRQFSATVDKTTAKINLNDLRFFDPTAFSPSSLGNSNMVYAKFRIVSDETINSKLTVNNGGACQGTLSAAFSAVFTVKGKLNEYSLIVIYQGSTTVVNTYNVTNADRTNNQATLTVNLSVNGLVCANAPSTSYNTIALKVDGSTQIQPDLKTTSIKLNIGGNTYDLTGGDKPSHEIQLNATTLYIPLVGVNPTTGRETYIKLQADQFNSSVGSINVIFYILASDGSITASLSKTLTPGTALTVTGTELKNAVVSAGKSVGDSFAVKVLVTAPSQDIFAYANIVDPTGAKRVPVKLDLSGGATPIVE